jgi:hypothetical protein
MSHLLIRYAHRWLEHQKEEGRRWGPRVLEQPAGEWRSMMASDERYRSYGTIELLLQTAHEWLVERPTDARELTAALLEFAANEAAEQTADPFRLACATRPRILGAGPGDAQERLGCLHAARRWKIAIVSRNRFRSKRIDASFISAVS